MAGATSLSPTTGSSLSSPTTGSATGYVQKCVFVSVYKHGLIKLNSSAHGCRQPSVVAEATSSSSPTVSGSHLDLDSESCVWVYVRNEFNVGLGQRVIDVLRNSGLVWADKYAGPDWQGGDGMFDLVYKDYGRMIIPGAIANEYSALYRYVCVASAAARYYVNACRIDV